MKQRILCLAFFSVPFLIFAQGIQWTTGLSWEQVKQKAKAESKYIFIDMYATWCGPCKTMDRFIYPLKEVGDIYNQKFISLRVQADKTDKDDQNVKRWYADAKKISVEYNISAYPTFLFFSPDGELVHRASGAFNLDKFISLGTDALAEKGYVFLIDKFKRGDCHGINLKDLALNASYARDDILARKILEKYIESTPIQELVKEENMAVLIRFAEGDKDWGKRILMPKLTGTAIDQLAHPAGIRFLLYGVKNDSLACKVADSWISSMTYADLRKKDTLKYIGLFVRSSKDKAFNYLYNNKQIIDKILGEDNWAQDRVNDVIYNEEFYYPILSPAAKLMEQGSEASILATPDWKKLYATIAEKYDNNTANQLRYRFKINWYNLVDNKMEYTKNLVAEMDRTKGWKLDGIELNNNAMEVFTYSKNRREISKAANWMRRYFRKNPKEMKTDATGLDTYAILLYKAGRVKKGIKFEEKAAMINPSDSEIVNNLSKMKKGLPIWQNGFNVKK